MMGSADGEVERAAAGVGWCWVGVAGALDVIAVRDPSCRVARRVSRRLGEGSLYANSARNGSTISSASLRTPSRGYGGDM